MSRPARDDRPLSHELDRRFEAIVLVGEGALASAATDDAVRRLLAAGVDVALLARLPVDQLVERFGPVAPDSAVLLLADSRGTDVALVDASGVCRTSQPPGGRGGQALGPDLDLDLDLDFDRDLLDKVARAVVDHLAGLELTAMAVPAAEGAPVAVVELVPPSLPGSAAGTLDDVTFDGGLPGPAELAQLVRAVAQEAGVVDPRVSVRGLQVELALRDESDALRWAQAELWRRGVGRRNTLIVAGELAATDHGLRGLTGSDVEGATIVSLDTGDGFPPTGVLRLAATAGDGLWLLGDQLRRRSQRALPAPALEPGWGLAVDGLDPQRERVDEALLALADGRIGISGSPLLAHPGTGPAVLVGGVYDRAGPATHLLTAPIAFQLGGDMASSDQLWRALDLHAGVLHERVATPDGDIQSARFASLARPGTLVLRARSGGRLEPGPPLVPPRDHRLLDEGAAGDASWMRVASDGSGGVVTAAADACVADENGTVLDRVAVYQAHPESVPDPEPAIERLRAVSAAGFDTLLAEHRQAWASRWENADIVIEGDTRLQLATRFALFHLMGSVGDVGEAAVGARGLSGTSYRGHVFWDADTFVLPFLAATHPESARAMLEYRLRRLPAAMAAAREAARAGARFPWESARSGRDVTPTSARDGSGRLVPIRTGQLEEHIVAQVPWAACCYVDWTGDEEFARGPGLRLLVETARYWASRARVEPDGGAHIYGVIGPDEYHEPVDDNAFTNVMARWNLRRAADAVDAAGADGHGVDAGEQHRWRELADALTDGFDPNTGVYEQFAGFGRLEPLIIKDVAPRRPIAADVLLGAERVRGAQVLKQADVLMLYHLVPDELQPGTLEANLRFYEPRTAHGSSLSPGVHASLFARARDYTPALDALDIASRMDLEDLTRSTAGGLHLATMGALWQALAFGFAGLRPRGDVLHIEPRLPPKWSALEVRVRFRGSRVRVRHEPAHLSIHADRPTPVAVDGKPFSAGPATLQLHRPGASWEVVP